MSRIRLLLAWVLMASIPLQGLAASSMLFCGVGMAHTAARVQAAMQVVASVEATAASAHDHSQHRHAAPMEDVETTTADAAMKLPDTAHKCPVCAACCNLVVVTEVPLLAIAAPASQAELPEPFVLIHARPLPVPDKPPRA